MLTEFSKSTINCLIDGLHLACYWVYFNPYMAKQPISLRDLTYSGNVKDNPNKCFNTTFE